MTILIHLRLIRRNIQQLFHVDKNTYNYNKFEFFTSTYPEDIGNFVHNRILQ
jgi:hypothetical protein